MLATSLQRCVYKNIIKPVLFRLDPEKVHDRFVRLGALLGSNAAMRSLAAAFFHYQHPALVQEIRGIRFPNPVGLAAGFDKNGQLTRVLPCVGFGFAEIGSVTGEPCEGNPRPRLWRLPQTRGLVVNYGLRNDGCEAIAARLAEERFDIPIGINIAKTNSPRTLSLHDGIADYLKAFRAFLSIGQYYTVNISCPNAFGGEPFADPDRLDALLAALDAIPTEKPVFLKITADASLEDADRILEVADRHRIHGFVISNLTKRRDAAAVVPGEVREEMKGGISGRPVFALSNNLISHVYSKAGSRYTIIGVGGVFSAEDAYEMIRRGASLIELATGMIFQGPQVIGEINRGLVGLLQRDGFSNVREAVGAAFRDRVGV